MFFFVITDHTFRVQFSCSSNDADRIGSSIEKITREDIERDSVRNRRGFRTFEGRSPEDVDEAIAAGCGGQCPSAEDIAGRFKAPRKVA